MVSKNKYERYLRQIKLKELGTSGQDKLMKSKVLMIGAGGLGCAALPYLAAAGIGQIGIVDFDIVELSNLQRQTLYSIEDVGKSKTLVAVQKLKRFNPEIQIDSHQLKLESHNALKIICNYDIVIDGSDNFSTRYMVNDACTLLNKPLVYGSVLRFEGQVSVFNYCDQQGKSPVDYRDLFPAPPSAESVPDCAEAGVLGVLPGIIGALQVNECIKIITGIGQTLCNSILTYNCLSNQFYEFSIQPNKNKSQSAPSTEHEFVNFNYNWFCGTEFYQNEIAVEDFKSYINNKKFKIIDVREKEELPLITEFPHEQLSLKKIEEWSQNFSKEDTIILFCKSGKRSQTALRILTDKIPEMKLYSLKGGIEAWKNYSLQNENVE